MERMCADLFSVCFCSTRILHILAFKQTSPNRKTQKKMFLPFSENRVLITIQTRLNIQTCFKLLNKHTQTQRELCVLKESLGSAYMKCHIRPTVYTHIRLIFITYIRVSQARRVIQHANRDNQSVISMQTL